MPPPHKEASFYAEEHTIFKVNNLTYKMVWAFQFHMLISF